MAEFLITRWGVSEILLFSLFFIYFSRFDTHFHDRKTQKFETQLFFTSAVVVVDVVDIDVDVN